MAFHTAHSDHQDLKTLLVFTLVIIIIITVIGNIANEWGKYYQVGEQENPGRLVSMGELQTKDWGLKLEYER